MYSIILNVIDVCCIWYLAHYMMNESSTVDLYCVCVIDAIPLIEITCKWCYGCLGRLVTHMLIVMVAYKF